MKKIISILTLVVLISACKKTELPVQSNQEVASVASSKPGSNSVTVNITSVYVGTAISVRAYGSISSTGTGSIKERGFCYGTSTGPTIANDTARAGSGTGNFDRLIEGLSPGTTYYVRAYAIENKTVYYGNELSFTTLSLGLPTPGVGIVYDIDGNAYNTLTYGTQVWMIENLKTTHFKDGSEIPNVTANTPWSSSAIGTSSAYCDYDNNPANAAAYGRLYNMLAMKDSRGIAPAGWHVPNYSEWNTLIKYLGGLGGRMKETGFTHWLSPNTDADNSSGFTAVGSGDRAWTDNGTFFGLKIRSSLWSSSSYYNPGSNAVLYAIYLNYNSASITMSLAFSANGVQNYGFAIRCVKD